MNFIKRLKQENKTEELANFIRTNCGKNDWEIKFINSKSDENTLEFLIDCCDKSLSWFVLTDFDCVVPNDLITENMHINEVDAKMVRISYLKFMKKTFKNYKEEYIKNVDDLARQAKIEIIAL